MNLCALCLRACRGDFCGFCEERLRTLSLRDEAALHALEQGWVLSSLPYLGLGRDCVLRCKVGGFRRLGQALGRWVARAAQVQERVGTCDVIMPAPSSLWSRWRGNLDLAALIAGELAGAWGVPLRWPPWMLSFRWKKQALRGSSQRRGVFRSHQKLYDASYFVPRGTAPLRSARLKVLLVDDVITSGSTLNGLAACFEGIDFQFYTLASALRSGKDQHAES